MVIIVTLFSIAISYFVLVTLKRDPLIRNSIYLVYLVWHMPLVLSIILPFNYYGIEESEKITTIILILTGIHCIVFSGVFAYHDYKKKKYRQSNYQIISQESLNKSNYYLLLYIPLAILATIALILNTQELGYHLSVSAIEQNRNIYTGGKESTLFTLMTGLFSGTVFYLAYKSINIKNNNMKFSISNININWLLISPPLIYVLINFLLGKKLYMMPLILMIVFRIIYLAKPNFKRLNSWLILTFFIVLNITVIINLLRSGNTIYSFNRKVNLNEYHLLSSIIDRKNHPLLYVYSSSLYTNFGIAYDTLHAAISTFKTPIFPLGSLTADSVYSKIYGSLDKSYREKNYYNKLSKKYNVFTGVWGTMFLFIYLEGGWLFILTVMLILSFLHFGVVKNYMIEQNPQNKEDSVLLLIIFYCVMIVGIQKPPLANPIIVSFIMVAVAKSYINRSLKLFLKPIIKKKYTSTNNKN